MNSPLEVFSDLSERLHYNDPKIPLYVRRDALRRYGYAAACHWHPDLEFILILEGSMDYFVNGKFVHLAARSGIFVNSRRLHYGFSANKTDCSFAAVVFHPALFSEGSQAAKEYLDGKFGPDTDDFILLSPEVSWQREDLRLLGGICEETYGGAVNPLRLLSRAAALCADLGDHLRPAPERLADDPLRAATLTMTEFVHRHYESRLTLDEVAASGAVCRSRCCELFRRYTGQSPNAYLTRYRIAKSCEMLRETNRTVCEIAIACGFQSASYFSSVFRKATGSTPQDYRKETAAPAFCLSPAAAVEKRGV